MCIVPAAPKVPLQAQYQQMQVPQDPVSKNVANAANLRRGLWASIMTSPKGVTTAPTVTGTGAGVLGA